ncbi:methyltransferase [Desulfocurvus sp. DL9XJH121]
MDTPSTPIPEPRDPSSLYRVIHGAEHGYKQLQALRAALDAGLFEALDEPTNSEVLAGSLGTDPGVTLALCRVLEAMGLLAKTAEGFRNTPEAHDFLRRSSPLFQGPVVDCVLEGLAPWDGLGRVLRDGPVELRGDNAFAGNFIHALARETLTGEMQRTTDILAAVPGFDGVRTLLDLGGGHGLYSVGLCDRFPELTATVFDLPGMAEAVLAYADLSGGERVRFRGGNQFSDPLGQDWDAVLLSYNPGGKSRMLLDKIHDALAPGGFFITKHAYYARGERSKAPLLDLEWSMSVFPGVTKGPNIYSFKGDMSHEEVLHYLSGRYEILRTAGVPEFAPQRLGKVGDRLDSILIVARKPLGGDA